MEKAAFDQQRLGNPSGLLHTYKRLFQEPAGSPFSGMLMGFYISSFH